MILSDFLLRQNVDDRNPREIIPISFNIRTVLQDKYYNLEGANERYMIQTTSQMKTSGMQLPEVHGTRKGLDPHKIPHKQLQPIVRLCIEKRPRLGKGRAGMRRKVKLAHLLRRMELVQVQDLLSQNQSLSMMKMFQGWIQYYLSLYQRFLEVRYYHHIFFHETDLLQNP